MHRSNLNERSFKRRFKKQRQQNTYSLRNDKRDCTMLLHNIIKQLGISNESTAKIKKRIECHASIKIAFPKSPLWFYVLLVFIIIAKAKGQYSNVSNDFLANLKPEDEAFGTEIAEDIMFGPDSEADLQKGGTCSAKKIHFKPKSKNQCNPLTFSFKRIKDWTMEHYFNYMPNIKNLPLYAEITHQINLNRHGDLVRLIDRELINNSDNPMEMFLHLLKSAAQFNQATSLIFCKTKYTYCEHEFEKLLTSSLSFIHKSYRDTVTHNFPCPGHTPIYHSTIYDCKGDSDLAIFFRDLAIDTLKCFLKIIKGSIESKKIEMCAKNIPYDQIHTAKASITVRHLTSLITILLNKNKPANVPAPSNWHLIKKYITIHKLKIGIPVLFSVFFALVVRKWCCKKTKKPPDAKLKLRKRRLTKKQARQARLEHPHPNPSDLNYEDGHEVYDPTEDPTEDPTKNPTYLAPKIRKPSKPNGKDKFRGKQKPPRTKRSRRQQPINFHAYYNNATLTWKEEDEEKSISASDDNIIPVFLNQERKRLVFYAYMKESKRGVSKTLRDMATENNYTIKTSSHATGFKLLGRKISKKLRKKTGWQKQSHQKSITAYEFKPNKTRLENIKGLRFYGNETNGLEVNIKPKERPIAAARKITKLVTFELKTSTHRK